MQPKNLQKVYKVFKQNYQIVPLEIFGSNPYKTLVSTILSARTNDDTTLKVCKEKLFIKAPNIKTLSKLTEQEISELIYPVGFYKTKAKHLKKMSEILVKKFGGKIPNTREELMSLPGVGRKTANLVLNRAFKIPAIAVDTHVHRITNLLGWVKTKQPLETEQELIKIIPQKYWPEMNKFFVSIGRKFRSQKKLVEFLKENDLI
ncbi:endonuclease III [Candidatus Microgenomates bacterium]|nr:endonuclease III [Candidatus Microgenomates bacterium]